MDDQMLIRMLDKLDEIAADIAEVKVVQAEMAEASKAHRKTTGSRLEAVEKDQKVHMEEFKAHINLLRGVARTVIAVMAIPGVAYGAYQLFTIF